MASRRPSCGALRGAVCGGSRGASGFPDIVYPDAGLTGPTCSACPRKRSLKFLSTVQLIAALLLLGARVPASVPALKRDPRFLEESADRRC